MKFMSHLFGHLRVVLTHKYYVFRYCCRVGIPWQGLTHDLSKFSPTEFFPSVRYFQGDKSPIGEERRQNGYSSAWLHHKSRNRHHWEYWVEFRDDGTQYLVKIPMKYTKEMLCDWIAAGKTYCGKSWTQAQPLNYFNEHQAYYKLNPATHAFALKALTMFRDEGEDKTLQWLREQKRY